MAEEPEESEGRETPKPARRVKKVLREPGAEAAKEPAPAAPVEVPAKKAAAAAAAGPAKKAAPRPAAKPRPKAPAAPKVPDRKEAPKAAPETEAEEGPASEDERKPAEKPAPKPARVAKKARKPEEPAKKAKKVPKKAEGEEEAEEGEAEEKEHVVRAKPELADAVRAALRIRRQIGSKRPAFYRQEWYRYKRLGMTWRKPQGGQSKLRRHYGYRINVVSIGYRGPRSARGLHPSGFQEVLVHTIRDLKAIDPKRQAARIGGTVGGRMRDILQKEAEELGVRVLNRREE